MITEVKAMMIERLQEYEERQKTYPKRVLIFRDGVRGLVQLVLEKEPSKIRRAFQVLTVGQKKSCNPGPALTIAIRGKRHHVRLYPTREEDADDWASDTKTGTVIDSGITSPFDFVFSLQAHAALKGPVRAAHYTVRCDENKFDADENQQGTNDVSYL